MRKYVKTFENFSDVVKPQTYGRPEETMLCKLSTGSYITQEEVNRNINTIGNESLYDDKGMEYLQDIIYHNRKIDKNGGDLWRIFYLYDYNEVDTNNLGKHWSPELYMLNDNLGRFHSTMSSVIKDRTPYILKAWTPPHNNSLPGDIFANLEEIEILILDPAKVKPLELFDSNMVSLKIF